MSQLVRFGVSMEGDLLARFDEGGISDKVSYSKNSSELNGHSTVQTPQNSIDMQS